MYYLPRLLKKMIPAAQKNSKLGRGSKAGCASQLVNTVMGNYSYCGANCVILNAQIGNYCSIADGVTIGGARHPYEWVSTSPAFYEDKSLLKKKYCKNKREDDKPVYIGADVWIGKGAYINQGVNIGHGAVIAMGSVVTKDVEPYSIVGGNPARLIKKRFSEKEIHAILASNWWEWDEKVMKEKASAFNDISLFLQILDDK